MIAALLESLRVLAAPADQQLALYRQEMARADQLALDFADAFRLVCDCPQVRLTPSQTRALQELDILLEEMTSQGDAQLWTTHALQESAAWTEVRAAAGRALRTLDEISDRS
jgi:hypothetical protein